MHVYSPNIVSHFSGDDYIVLNGKTSVHRVRVVQEFRYESYLINVTDKDEGLKLLHVLVLLVLIPATELY